MISKDETYPHLPQRGLTPQFINRPFPALITALLLTFMTGFLITPVILSIGSGFFIDGRLSLYWFGRVISNPILMAEFGNGLLLAICTTAFSLLLAVPLAVLRTRFRFRGLGFLSILILLPLILPPFVGAISMKRLLGQFGVLNLFLEKVGLIDMSQALPPDWLGSGFIGVVILQGL